MFGFGKTKAVDTGKYRKLTREEDLERNGIKICKCGHDDTFDHRWTYPCKCRNCSCDKFEFSHKGFR